jgi:UPF0755 protein
MVVEDISFIIKKGDTFQNILNNLIEENIIINKSRFIFINGSKLIANRKKIKAGEYIILKNSSIVNIIRQIESGKVHNRKITIAEGLTNDTIFKMINKIDILTGNLPDKETIMEGTLLPETYYYQYGDTKMSLVKQMQNAMFSFFNKEWENRDKNLPFNTKQEALSLASIVEKETGVSSERGKVASVFINRLKKKMRLQSDPTVVYAFTKGNKELDREIKKSDLEYKNEYNTYKIYGIPHKPIANPGKDSIKAVLHPENTNFLYFVATGDGGHNFSINLNEHNKHVNNYRKKITK